jgi:YidC/Oxa1 family membrane protein insertase
MEQARMFIAIGLSFLVFFVWQYFFVEPQQPAQISEKKTQTSAEPSQTAAVEPAAVLPSQASALPEGTPVLKEAREVTVSTAVYGGFIRKGGCV